MTTKDLWGAINDEPRAEGRDIIKWRIFMDCFSFITVLPMIEKVVSHIQGLLGKVSLATNRLVLTTCCTIHSIDTVNN